MYPDPTEAIKETILARGFLREGVQDILAHQREAQATDEEAADALQTYILGQMYGELRKSNPLLAAYEEARAAEDIAWWRLLYSLGWRDGDSVQELPF